MLFSTGIVIEGDRHLSCSQKAIEMSTSVFQALRMGANARSFYFRVGIIYYHSEVVKMRYNILLMVILLVVIASGCTGGKDITSTINALPEVQQYMKEHPNAIH